MIIFFFHNWLTTLFINVIHFSQCLIVQLYSILISKTGMLKRLLTWIKVSYNIHLPRHYNLLIHVSQIHLSLIISFLLFLLFFYLFLQRFIMLLRSMVIFHIGKSFLSPLWTKVRITTSFSPHKKSFLILFYLKHLHYSNHDSFRFLSVSIQWLYTNFMW